MTEPTVVIGVGNPFRRDDGVGPAVVARLREVAPAEVLLADRVGEPTDLLDQWAGTRLAVVIDALAPAGEPGRVHRLELHDLDDRPHRSSASSHALGVRDVVALGALLDRLPGRLVVFGVEAADLGEGPGLSEPVEAVVEVVAQQVLAEIEGGGG